jgi:hypothetical protein
MNNKYLELLEELIIISSSNNICLEEKISHILDKLRDYAGFEIAIIENSSAGVVYSNKKFQALASNSQEEILKETSLLRSLIDSEIFICNDVTKLNIKDLS